MKKLLIILVVGIFFGTCFGSNYSLELQQAYSRAYNNKITTTNSIESAKMDGTLTRIAMAKMLSQYAINVLGKEPDLSKGTVKFNDVTDKQNSEYNNAVTLSYQLGIMGQGTSNFRPNDEVTRAEFATALSRMLYSTSDGNPYYTTHLKKLKEEGVITKDNPDLKEKRGYVMLMLMRSVGKNTNKSTNTNQINNETNKVNTGTLESFPYATKEIKQQLAEKIYNERYDTLNGYSEGMFYEKDKMPSDYFETISYFPVMQLVMQKGLSVLGDTTEQQVFWYYIMRLRMMILFNTLSFSSEDKAWFNVYLDDMGKFAVEYIDEHPKEGAELFASVIAYEEKYPYNPQKTIDKISKMTKQDFAKEFNMTVQDLSEQSEEELREELLELYGLRKMPNDFTEIREKVLQLFKNDLDMLQSGKTIEEYIKEKNAENGIADYSFYLQSPKLFPSELIFAEFVMDPEDDDYRYAFRKLFFSNNGVGGTRIEDEKPLPYKVDMIWYSITENKVYSLEADLPNAEIRKLFFPDTEKFDGILLTLAPHGQVVVYAYNTIYGTKEKIVTFQAEEYQLSFDNFSEVAMYGNFDNEIKNWKDYQKNVLETVFPEALENLKKKGIPNKDSDFWTEDDEF